MDEELGFVGRCASVLCILFCALLFVGGFVIAYSQFGWLGLLLGIVAVPLGVLIAVVGISCVFMLLLCLVGGLAPAVPALAWLGIAALITALAPGSVLMDGWTCLTILLVVFSLGVKEDKSLWFPLRFSAIFWTVVTGALSVSSFNVQWPNWQSNGFGQVTAGMAITLTALAVWSHVKCRFVNYPSEAYPSAKDNPAKKADPPPPLSGVNIHNLLTTNDLPIPFRTRYIMFRV